jgi:phosphoglycerate dehydrogenase-like enzyme
MRIIGVRRNPDSLKDQFAEIYTLENLPILLPEVDVLLIALPLTPETENLIGEVELSLMPQGAVLVNIGRGPIVEQGALYQALKDGHLRGAGLDVWYNYPPDESARANTPPADYAFHELENIVMSPHRGGGSDGTEELRMIHLAKILNLTAAGESIPNRVDLTLGY